MKNAGSTIDFAGVLARSAVALSCFLSGCAFLPGAFGAATTDWPVKKGTGENPSLSGEPLQVGYEQNTTCDSPFVGGGTKLSVEGEQLCLTRRILTTTPVEQTSPPMIHGALLEIVTPQGRSENISLSKTQGAFLSECAVGMVNENYWGTEVRACVPNTVLTSDTNKVTVRELINTSWVDIIEWSLATAAADSGSGNQEGPREEDDDPAPAGA